MPPRLTLLAKGNLDVRDPLVALRLGGVVRWNGLNELLRARPRPVVARVRHETAVRSDALLAADGRIPEALAALDLPLGAHPLATQVSTAIYDAPADALVLSVLADVLSPALRHRTEGWFLNPAEPERWPAATRAWARANLEPLPPLSPEASRENLAGIVARVRRRWPDRPILVLNAPAAVPGERVHRHLPGAPSLATRIRAFNLALVRLSEDTGVSIVDVDRAVAGLGAGRALFDPWHLTAEGCAAVCAEVVAALEDAGLLDGEAA